MQYRARRYQGGIEIEKTYVKLATLPDKMWKMNYVLEQKPWTVGGCKEE